MSLGWDLETMHLVLMTFWWARGLKWMSHDVWADLTKKTDSWSSLFQGASLPSPSLLPCVCLCVCEHAHVQLCPTLCECVCVCVCVFISMRMLSCVQLFATDLMDCSLPDSSVHGIPRQEYWSGLLFPSPGYLPNSGIQLAFPASPASAGGFFITGLVGLINHWVSGTFLCIILGTWYCGY